MCALQKPSSSFRTIVLRACESLRALLQSSCPSANSISEATDALQELLDDLRAARRRGIEIGETNQRQAASCATAAAHTEQVDSEIIRAKLEAGEFLTVRDSIARDLGRARKTLSMLEEERKETEESASVVGDTKEGNTPGGSWDFDSGDDNDRLAEFVAEEMEKMRVAEKSMVGVIDEITAIRTRRAELDAKLKAAQEEW